MGASPRARLPCRLLPAHLPEVALSKAESHQPAHAGGICSGEACQGSGSWTPDKDTQVLVETCSWEPLTKASIPLPRDTGSFLMEATATKQRRGDKALQPSDLDLGPNSVTSCGT